MYTTLVFTILSDHNKERGSRERETVVKLHLNGVNIVYTVSLLQDIAQVKE